MLKNRSIALTTLLVMLFLASCGKNEAEVDSAQLTGVWKRTAQDGGVIPTAMKVETDSIAWAFEDRKTGKILFGCPQKYRTEGAKLTTSANRVGGCSLDGQEFTIEQLDRSNLVMTYRNGRFEFARSSERDITGE